MDRSCDVVAMDRSCDVVVGSGGAGRPSGATRLARSRRSVPVLDVRGPRDAPAGVVHRHLPRGTAA